MKEKLKTLKDIKPCDTIKEGKNTLTSQIFGKQIADRHFSEFVLKQEAIKWVKHFGKTSEDFIITGGMDCTRFIKYFFNLTEEDLK